MGEQVTAASEEGARKKRIFFHPVTWGVLFTVLLCLLAIFLGRTEHCFHENGCISNFEIFLESTPNEIGDTLAGFAGALAFVWIIVTVWLQSKELAAQREELAATRKELKLAAKAQQSQVAALEAQTTIFENEQRHRDEAQAQMLLEESLKTLILTIKDPSADAPYWVFSDEPFDPEFGSMGETYSFSFVEYIDDSKTIDAAIGQFRRSLQGMRETLWDYLHQTSYCVLPEKSDYISKLIARIEKILEMKCSLSLPQQEHLSRLRLEEIPKYLNTLLETPELWKVKSP